MNIRLSKINDIDEIMQIFEQARISIAGLGIDQWQNGYPTYEIIKEDIEKSRSYVLLDENKICATFVLVNDGEPAYNKIYEGEWKTNGNYIALHRIALADGQRGKGTGKKIIDFFCEYAKENRYTSIRVDTHKGNIPMRKMLQKNGFEYCGIIRLYDGIHNGDERVAYEKIV